MKILSTILKILVSVAILSFLFYWAWKDDQFRNAASAEKQWHWLALGFFGCLTAHMIGYVRWRMLVRALELPFSIYDAIRIGLIGTFFSVFAMGTLGGDSLRAFYVTRQMTDRKAEAASSVVVDRLIGLLTMFLFASVAFMIFGIPGEGMKNPEKLNAIKLVATISMCLAGGGLAGIAVLLFTPQLTNTSSFKKLTKLPKVGSLIERLAGVVQTYRDKPGLIASCFLMSVGVNVCFAFSIFAIAAGISTSHPNMQEHFLIEPISMVANALPLGGMEFTLNYLYSAFTRSTAAGEIGIVVAFLFRFTILLVAALGAVAWLMNRKQLADVVQAVKEDAGE